MEEQTHSSESTNPETSQPWMFGGHIGAGKLPWLWATERLTEARNYWIVTTRPTGQPHSRPVWASGSTTPSTSAQAHLPHRT